MTACEPSTSWRHGLADVVQQRGAARRLERRAELGGHDRRDVRALERVAQDVLAVARAVLEAAEQLDQLGVQARHVGLEARLLAVRGRSPPRSRPSPGSTPPRCGPGGCARRRRASRRSAARSRGGRRRSPRARPPAGVSSMITSTPVRFSSARMLRPSRPMMRPFMSSEGSSTIETVVSAAWLAAVRWMPIEMMLRTRRSDS